MVGTVHWDQYHTTSTQLHDSSSKHHDAPESGYLDTFRLPEYFFVVERGVYWKMCGLRLQPRVRVFFSGQLQPALQSRCSNANMVAG